MFVVKRCKFYYFEICIKSVLLGLKIDVENLKTPINRLDLISASLSGDIFNLSSKKRTEEMIWGAIIQTYNIAQILFLFSLILYYNLIQIYNNFKLFSFLSVIMSYMPQHVLPEVILNFKCF